jgi:DNA-binding SARP family transcriptional activator
VRRGDALELAPAVAVDAVEFERAADTALAGRDAVEAAAALRGYEGDLLPESSYEPWVAVPRERLRRRYVALLDLVADAAADDGRWDDAVAAWDRAVAFEPLDTARALRAAARLRDERPADARSFADRAAEAAAALGIAVP